MCDHGVLRNRRLFVAEESITAVLSLNEKLSRLDRQEQTAWLMKLALPRACADLTVNCASIAKEADLRFHLL